MRQQSPGRMLLAGVASLVAAGGVRLILAAPQSSTAAPPQAASPAAAATPAPQLPHLALLDGYCFACHDDARKEAGFSLEPFAVPDVGRYPEVWEKVVRKLRARQMPPIGEDRPDEGTYDAVVASLETALDRAAEAHPNPGRTATLRRLTRTEYQYAIRDLLDVDIDAAALLPADDSSYGFDNITVGTLSPTLLDRYLAAAEKISRLAVGRAGRASVSDTIRIAPDVTQEDHVEGLPIGTRGGALIPYTFPLDGEYEIQVRLRRDRDELVEGLSEPHEVELILDRERLQVFTVRPPQRQPGLPAAEQPSQATVDQHLTLRVPVRAGPHELGATFVKKPTLLAEGVRQPYQARFNSLRHPRLQPAIYSVTIAGPIGAGAPGKTPSRRRIFVTRPASPADEPRAAREILSALARRAYRRPVTDVDLRQPLARFAEGRADGGFEAGIELALTSILISPQFLFRVERDPAGLPPHTPYRISDLELASRLSFFLWSSLPDAELLEAASKGRLHEPALLDAEVRRMLADPRARALVTNFAGQWLHLPNLDAITPDMRLFPDFDDNLRQAFRQETELFVESILREDRSVLDLLSADYTFLNERLAKHYGVPGIYGSRFRRVALDDEEWRGGLLRQGSILTVTSYATRTSPVVRGKWMLDNLLGMPPPPPLPDVPALKDNTVDGSLSGRKRLAEHRSHAICASCHNVIDPLGLALERYDAVGRRRLLEDGEPIDASGALPGGAAFEDVDGLEAALVARPDLFVGALTEKLLTYALGRGLDYYDAPAVRRIVRDAKPEGFRLSSIILGVVRSRPFQMRTTP